MMKIEPKQSMEYKVYDNRANTIDGKEKQT